jgi:hypothetical protein
LSCHLAKGDLLHWVSVANRFETTCCETVRGGCNEVINTWLNIRNAELTVCVCLNLSDWLVVLDQLNLNTTSNLALTKQAVDLTCQAIVDQANLLCLL